MDLERLSVALRPRNNWEAVDLGIRLAIRHFVPLYAAWLAVAVPVAVVLFLICQYWLENLVWLYFFLWWLKPLFDRVAVHVIGHAVFGEVPTVRATLRALPRLLTSTRLFAGLTWGRFSFRRSIGLPIDVLEGLKGSQARQRKALIGRRVTGTALCQALLFQWVLEPVLWVASLALLLMLIPESMMPDFEQFSDFFSHPPAWFGALLYSALLLASVLLEPLYVAGGFMLYIKRRTDLEAWDVELQLRRLAHAHKEEQSSALARNFLGIVLCVALSIGFMLPSTSSYAADTAGLREQHVTQSTQEIQQVLKDPRFGKEVNDRELHWKHAKEKQDKKASKAPPWLQNILESLAKTIGGIGKMLSSLGRVGGWILIGCVVALILYLISRFGWGGISRSNYVPPAELAGFDIRPQSLPDDVAGTALGMLRSGNTRGALSLLFRGTLSRLAHQEQVPFVRGDTEGDCLTRVREHAPQRSAFMARLLGCWQRLAYAHAQVTPEEVEALCREWWREFGGGPRE